jgi:hypothetical protein
MPRQRSYARQCHRADVACRPLSTLYKNANVCALVLRRVGTGSVVSDGSAETPRRPVRLPQK